METKPVNKYNISYSKSADLLKYTGDDLVDPLHTSPTVFNDIYFPIHFCSEYREPNSETPTTVS